MWLVLKEKHSEKNSGGKGEFEAVLKNNLKRRSAV